MAKDGSWGDQVILFAAANCYGCVVRVISSVPNYEDVIILPNPPVCDAVELVVGHIFEQHYVSLIPIMSGKTRVCASPLFSLWNSCGKSISYNTITPVEIIYIKALLTFQLKTFL